MKASTTAVVIDEQTASLRSMLDTVERQKAQLTATVEEMQTQQELIRALSAPILPVLTGVLVLPVIGTLDAERAAALEQHALQTVESQRTHAVIFDVTGLAVMDVPVADALLRTAAALRLLGARVILVGIRPEVAQTLTMIGRSFQQIAGFGEGALRRRRGLGAGCWAISAGASLSAVGSSAEGEPSSTVAVLSPLRGRRTRRLDRRVRPCSSLSLLDAAGALPAGIRES